MTSIFEFIKKDKVSSPKQDISKPEPKLISPIFERAKELPEETEPSRIRSLVSAPAKGFVKGITETGETAKMLQDPLSPLLKKLGLTGEIISPEQFEKGLEQILPTQEKAPERLLERGGRIASYLVGPGKALSKIIRGGIATIGGQLAEEFGLPKSMQSVIETGALLSPTSLRNTQKHINSLYTQAETLAGDAKIPAKNLVKNVQKFITDISKGGPAASKNPAMAQAKSILEKVKKGMFDVKELTEFKKTINEARGSLYTDQALDKVGKKTAKRYLDNISEVVDGALNEYGKSNPEWNQVYRSANEAHGAVANSKKVSNWIARTLHQHPHASGGAIAGTLIGHAFLPKTLAITGTAYAGIKSGELLARILKSKVLRKHYANMIKEATKENTAGFLNNLKRLEQSLESEDREED